MKEITIDSAEDLIRSLNELPNHFIFRGQADATWDLESSLERVLNSKWSAENARKFEDFSLKAFQSKFHLYDRENMEPRSKLAWLALMQHYGVPTRMIDFTESPYVALYFSLESYNPLSKSDLAIFALDYSAIMDRSLGVISTKDANFSETRDTIHGRQDPIFDEIVDRFAYDIAWVAEPGMVNSRIDRQAGSFLISGNRGQRIREILDSDTYCGVTMVKFVIAHTLYQSCFALLRKLNITSKCLYGNLDGLAREIRMQLQIYST